MDDREKVRLILTRMNPTLRRHLNLNEEFCVELKATVPQVISDDEHQEIQAISVISKKIDRLVDLMKRKSMNVFLAFMRVLQEKDNDLYNEVRAIQNEYLTSEDVERCHGAAAAASPLGYAVQAAFPRTTNHGDGVLHNDCDLTGEDDCRAVWRQTGQFSTQDSSSTWRFYSSGIAIQPDGDVAVLGFSQFAWGLFNFQARPISMIKVFSRNGSLRHSSALRNRVYLYDQDSTDFAVTQGEFTKYIVPGNNSIIYHHFRGDRFQKETYFRTGLTVSGFVNELMFTFNLNKCHCPKTLAIDSTNGYVIAGLWSNTIFICNENGRLRTEFSTPAEPRRLDVTSKGTIAATFEDNSLQLMDYSGNNVRVVERPPEVDRWRPYTVCCSKQDEIFVLNSDDNSVYWYTADGDQCLGCIIQWLDDPQGIAVTDDGQQLYVVERNQSLVKIFQRQ